MSWRQLRPRKGNGYGRHLSMTWERPRRQGQPFVVPIGVEENRWEVTFLVLVAMYLRLVHCTHYRIMSGEAGCCWGCVLVSLCTDANRVCVDMRDCPGSIGKGKGAMRIGQAV